MKVDHVVVGLGNPGPRYAMTRHNVGFMALDLWAQNKNSHFQHGTLGERCEAEWAIIQLGQLKLLLLKPMTFMNLSGQSVSRLYQMHSHLRDVPLTVVHDEVDVEFGKIRVKFGGSDAGHNGLKSMREALGHGEYNRVRLGVSRPPPDSDLEVKDWVLMNFSKSDKSALIDLISHSVEVTQALVEEGLQKALNVASKAK
jgi:PTH1 family peptidyl-tRNA hydrolase